MTNERILVVEDESIVAKDLQNRLIKLGYQVPAMASSGEEAIKKAEDLKPSLILMDIMLKGEMDGIQAAEYVHSNLDIPVIFLTAYADENTLKRAKITEPFGYILKPFEERELVTAIEIALYKHQMEKKLKESQELYRDLVENQGEGIGIIDQDEKFVFANPAEEAIFGVPSGGLIGRMLGDFADRQKVASILEQTKKRSNGEAESYEIDITRHDDEKRNLLITSTPKYDKKGRYCGAFAIFQDITKRKLMEKELRLKNRDLMIISSIASTINRANNIQDMLKDVLKGAMVLTGADAGAIYLYEKEDKTKMTLQTSTYSTDAGSALSHRSSLPRNFSIDGNKVVYGEKGREHISGLFDEEVYSIYVPILVKGESIGVIVMYTINPVPEGADKSAELLSIGSQLGIAIDNHLMMKKIQDDSRYLSDIINESPDAMLTVDKNGMILSFNKSASRLLGYLKDEMVGKHLSSLLPDGSMPELDETKSYVREFKCSDGSEITLNISTSRLYKDNIEFGFIITLKNLSEIVGLKIAPIKETAVDTEQLYQFDPGFIYLFDKSVDGRYMEIFADQVKHNIQGLCISRKNPKNIRQMYGLEKTPVVWLNSSDSVAGENCIKPDNLTGLTATLHKFLMEAEDGIILLDGMEYLMTRNSYESLLKFIHFINDRVMQSRCRVFFCIDTLALDERQYHILRSEMLEFEDHSNERPLRTRAGQTSH
ncbi:hypothetical protein CUJ83_14240 [Methanocella sp. CWC-04]|uniref:histidine kinase n=1 Tax=Methanooceanicella nereidis TaxID=2052831 RepID=A0AAP2W8F4_9EURY|nr:DUF835 domain-containing protein [Methanocella sp. CWC-04]MCD1296159.1 hypothetical protein [Methanocella sp. CWC-04]